MSSAPRRPRRAVRPSGTVGSDETVLDTRLPALPADPPTTASPAGSTDDLWRTTRSADDSDRGWGREESSSNDERLRREKPPHW